MKPTISLEDIMTELEQSRELLLKELQDGYREEESQSQPAESWSLIEIAYHLSLAELSILKLLKKLLRSAPRHTMPTLEALAAERERVRQIGLNREVKGQAPDGVVPRDAPTTLAEALERLRASREALHELMALRTFEELASISAPHPIPAFGAISGVGWLALIGVHERRHIEQIRALRAPTRTNE